jgi:hypothetical protein
MSLYHAGPKNLTEIKTLRQLIEEGSVSIEQAQESWVAKWGDWIEEDVLLAHPTMDEISLTTDLAEAQSIAKAINGTVYEVEAEIHRTNEEGYPVALQVEIIQVAA